MRTIVAMLLGALLGGGGAVALAGESAQTLEQVKALTPISPTDLLTRIKDEDTDLVVLDVRTPAEFAAGHVPGARNIPHDQLPAKLAEISTLKDRPVVLYCRSGRRSAMAGETLREAGFSELLQLEGDYPAWEAGGQPVETKSLESP